jgi:UDP-N-acetylmuramoyl-L-alanyl-D-glutamate--2,6-diaminopimelate ligase
MKVTINARCAPGRATGAMQLGTLCQQARIPCALEPEDLGIKITGLEDDSRNVAPGNMFVAIKGSKADGHLFLADAVQKGAKVLVVQDKSQKYGEAVIIQVPDTREALASLAHSFYGSPSEQMLVIGVTGTNGKTTTTYLIESILGMAGRKVGLIGTIEYRYGCTRLKAPNTTPSALRLADLFAKMRDDEVNAVVLEVSSHAIDQKRILGIHFDIGVFTNISQDHLDYHKTMNEYVAVKRSFFLDFLAKIPEAIGIFNLDDSYGMEFALAYPHRKLTYSLSSQADIRVNDYRFQPDGTHISLDIQGTAAHLFSPLLGVFNIMNILAAVAVGVALEISPDSLCSAIEQVRTIPGRFEQVTCGQPFYVIVDYAHTPDALSRVLVNARELTKGKIMTVFGCGGDRDQTKRPIMGRVVGEMSDYAIVTNDNPRTEDPLVIARAAEKGLREAGMSPERYKIILDRREAISQALHGAEPGGLVLIAGKGHEDYQIIGTTIHKFDDKAVAMELLQVL